MLHAWEQLCAEVIKLKSKWHTTAIASHVKGGDGSDRRWRSVGGRQKAVGGVEAVGGAGGALTHGGEDKLVPKELREGQKEVEDRRGLEGGSKRRANQMFKWRKEMFGTREVRQGVV